jgi:hypothetical protein
VAIDVSVLPKAFHVGVDDDGLMLLYTRVAAMAK